MSTWLECEDGSWVNLDQVNVIGVHVHDDGSHHVTLESSANYVVHSRHESEDAAEGTIGRFLAASGTRCLRRGI